jgi:hypothetical protein
MENKELFSALIKAQTELKNPPKTCTAKIKTKSGAEFSYSYADLPSIIDMTKPILARYGLAIIQTLVGDGEKVGIKTLLVHDSGQVIGDRSEDILYLPKSDIQGSSVQGMGASVTYGRRYAICSMLGISADEDTDAAEKSEDKETEVAATQNPSPARFSPKISSGSTTFTPPIPPTIFQTTQAVAPIATVTTPVAPTPAHTPVVTEKKTFTPNKLTFSKPNFSNFMKGAVNGK